MGKCTLVFEDNESGDVVITAVTFDPPFNGEMLTAAQQFGCERLNDYLQLIEDSETDERTDFKAGSMKTSLDFSDIVFIRSALDALKAACNVTAKAKLYTRHGVRLWPRVYRLANPKEKD